MPEDLDTSGRRVAPPRGRRHRHGRRPVLRRYWWLVSIAALIVAAPWIWDWIMAAHWKHASLPGYIGDSARVGEEYRELTGKTLDDAAATRQFEDATELMLLGSYTNAALLLEDTAKKVAVPAVFNNLGVLYTRLKDRPHAVSAFRDALARNHEYQAVRANIKNLKLDESIEPGVSEMEPNNNRLQANVVWLDRPVEAAIGAAGDVDCFWFTTSRPPRDRISIEITNRSTTLIPNLHVVDGSGKVLSGLQEASSPGASLRFEFSPPPNTLYNLEVDGISGTSGAYTLTIISLHAYDAYEPNDDIMNSTRIALGQPVEADIMDTEDTDFYSFVSPESSSVTIEVANRSKTLIPGLNSFASDLSHLGFGPEVKNAGDALHYTMPVQPNRTYYLQVFAKGDTTGPYTLLVR